MKERLLGKTPAELKEIAISVGLPSFAGGQIARWLYVSRVSDISEMTNISKAGRESLAEKYEVGRTLPIGVQESSDGTKKYLFPAVEDGDAVEAVMIPDGDRKTLCVSSQAGCRMGCKFCMTGRQGFHGNLATADILSQFLSIDEAEDLTNAVFMGMGEPLDNWESVRRALEVLTADWGFAWSPKRITLSSIGVIPNLRKYLDESKCHLAISLHNPFPEERGQLMPMEKAWHLRDIISLLKEYDFTGQRRVSFEYTMFDGFNDSLRHADELVRLLSGIECRVNLIRFHKIPDFPYGTSSREKMEAFRDRLSKRGVTSTIRASRGEDILAACGMLAGKHKKTDQMSSTLKKLIVSFLLIISSLSVVYAQDKWAAGFGLDPSDQEAIKAINARMDSIRKHRPTVALVLSGGGAKGAAHIGAIRHLESVGIPVDMVLGTSIGGLVGGMYALGYDSEYLDSLVRSIDWDLALSDFVERKYIPNEINRYKDTYALSVPFYYSIGDFEAMLSGATDGSLRIGADSDKSSSLFRKNLMGSLPSGFVQGLNVNSIFTSISVGYSDSLSFMDLPIPYLCVATDLVTGRAKVWHSGDINTAMRSTMSIPGLFTPVRTDGMVLVDGGMRNNFPADLAQSLGADLILGVELSGQAKDYNSIHNLADILWQGVDMLGNDSFRRNIKITDIRIKPDLDEFNMLSFSSEAVDTIMGRGYRAALLKDEELGILKEWVGSDTTVRHAPRAIDIGVTPVLISGLEVRGVRGEDAKYVMNKLFHLDSTYVDRQILEKEVAKLYGTGYFDFVGYELLGKTEPFRLCINCRKGPIHQLGVGVRFDTEEVVSALFNVGLNVHAISGHAGEITGKLGTNPFIDFRYFYKPSSGPVFNVRTKYKYVDRNQFNFLDNRLKMQFSCWRNEAYLGNVGWKDFEISLGIRSDSFRVSDLFSDRNYPDYSLSGFPATYFLGYVNAVSDTYDAGYFPSKGHKLGIDGAVVMGGDNTGMTYIASANYSKVFRIGSEFSLIPTLSARALLGKDKPFPYMNIIGGRMAGRYLDQQIPFMGVTNAVVMSPILAVVGLDARYELAKNNYLTATLNVGNSNNSFSDFLNISKDSAFMGVGLEYAYNTIAGPLRADIHWSSITKDVGFYLSFGYDF